MYETLHKIASQLGDTSMSRPAVIPCITALSHTLGYRWIGRKMIDGVLHGFVLVSRWLDRLWRWFA
jgi:hypothetical protein